MSEYSLEVTPLGSVCRFEFRLGDKPLYRLTVRADGAWQGGSEPMVQFAAVVVCGENFIARLHNGEDNREWQGPVPERAAVFG